MFSSVQFSRSVVSDSLRPHESQHARPPCPSPTPRVHSDSRPSSPWYHPTISSWAVPFSSCPQSLQASGSFPMSQLFAWGGQSTGASALASFLPKKSHGWSSEWTGWISLESSGPSRVFSNTTVQMHQFFGAQPSSQSNSYMKWSNSLKIHSFTQCVLVAQSCPTLCSPVNCGLLSSSVHEVLQARILEWVAISFSRGSPHQGTEPGSPILQADSLPFGSPGKPVTKE